MESPPSFSTHSEAPPLSEDSGLLITSGSFSSDSASGWHHIASELVESDDEERSLSLSGESTEASERMGGDLFNTVRKSGRLAAPPPPIDPPPQFQDSPVLSSTTVVVPVPIFATTNQSGADAARNIRQVSPLYPRKLKPESLYERRQCLNHRFASPRLLHLSPCRANRPSSRSSLSSRLSSSHNSLVTQFQADDSSFITQAISHDALSAGAGITDVYNVPLDSDIYSVPVDTLSGPASAAPAEPHRAARRRARSGTHAARPDRPHRPKERHKDTKTKRHSLPSSSKRSATDSDTDSLHLTLREMRKYLHTLYSSSSDSECRNTVNRRGGAALADVHLKHNCRQDSAKIAAPPVGTALFLKESIEITRTVEANDNIGHKKPARNCTRVKIKKHKETGPRDCSITEDNRSEKSSKKAAGQKVHMSAMRILSMSLKQSFCNLFRWRRSREDASAERSGRESPPAAVRRALPPLPPVPRDAHDPHGAADPHGAHAAHTRRSANEEDPVTDFATSIQKVKDYGWYWGPLSVEAAERVLSAEPDGSFIVRDSSDDHYIFTLTFKLNGLRHVRIEHDQGNFCFGGCTMFKAQTIVEFIENAVETSRSGRYLFFLNLRPALGPVRVQLLHPVSRFKRVQSLQHMCRFVVLKRVRRDLVGRLPLPRRLLDYLGAAHYYSELLADI